MTSSSPAIFARDQSHGLGVSEGQDTMLLGLLLEPVKHYGFDYEYRRTEDRSPSLRSNDEQVGSVSVRAASAHRQSKAITLTNNCGTIRRWIYLLGLEP